MSYPPGYLIRRPHISRTWRPNGGYSALLGPAQVCSAPGVHDRGDLVEGLDDRVRLPLGVPDLLGRDVAVRQVDRLQPGIVCAPHVVEEPVADVDAACRVGVLSNTIWSRAWHRGIFERDGVLDLVDGDVYTSEIPWTKPSPRAFAAALDAVGATDPARCVYVGDRLFDDVWGAHNAGLRAIHLPHSAIPPEQVGHTEGEPDAVVQTLAEIPEIVRRWG